MLVYSERQDDTIKVELSNLIRVEPCIYYKSLAKTLGSDLVINCREYRSSHLIGGLVIGSMLLVLIFRKFCQKLEKINDVSIGIDPEVEIQRK